MGKKFRGDFKLNTAVMVTILSILLLTIGATNSDLAFAHHKEGHDNGGGNDNGNNGNGNDNGNNGNGNDNGNNGNGNDNGKKKNKEKKDKRTDKEKYGEKSKNNLLEKIQKNKDKNKDKKKEAKEKKKEIIDFIKPNKNKDKKLDSKISKLVKSKDQKTFAKKNGFDYHNGITRVMINVDKLDVDTLKKINEIATIEISKENQMQISIPINKISKIQNISEIKNIESTLPPIQNKDIIVDGKIIEDSIFLNKTNTSSPVSVAIIDLSFDKDNQEISNNIIENVSFRHTFENSENIEKDYEALHGTAMAQIITSMVPDVKLHLLSAGTELEFLDAMDYAISENIEIITIAYSWVNHETDGTSSITKKVEEAIKSNISVIVPSGNYAENHWEGVFTDTDGDRWHEFSNSDEGITINVDGARVYQEKPILVYLKWKNEGNNFADYDLTLMDSRGKIVDYSSTLQENDSNNLEYLYFIPETPGEYYIGVSRFGESENSSIDIFSVYDNLEYSQSKGSAGVPSDAKGAIIVGSLGTDNQMQPYSSEGPTDNGQIVPNVLVNDGIITEAYDKEPFYGTSASTAYVSGLIAILYSEIEDINPMRVTDLLFENMLASQPKPTTELQITGNAGKLSKSNAISDWYRSLYENNEAGNFPIKFTSNEKNNYEIISCEKNRVLIQNTITKDVICVSKTTAESMIKRDWIIQY